MVITVPRKHRVLAAALVGLLWAFYCHADSTSNGSIRDWTKFPAVLRLTTSADVIAVGDVHGDFDRLATVLAANHVIAARPARPEDAAWVAGPSILVCTGDMIDHWTNGLAVVRFFRRLQPSARKAGGDVIVTMGNHEAEFLDPAGDHQRTQLFEAELRDAAIDPQAVRRGADPEGLGQFLRSLPIMAVINDWCFLHAGNSHGRTLDQLQTALEQGISAGGFGAPILSDPDSVLEARLRPRPWWEQGAAGPAEAEAQLRKWVEAMNCRHLVIGHQPKGVVFTDGTSRAAGELVSKFHGLVFLIDSGMSRGIGLSDGALLLIRDQGGTAFSLSSRGQASELWRNPANKLSSR